MLSWCVTIHLFSFVRIFSISFVTFSLFITFVNTFVHLRKSNDLTIYNISNIYLLNTSPSVMHSGNTKHRPGLIYSNCNIFSTSCLSYKCFFVDQFSYSCCKINLTHRSVYIQLPQYSNRLTDLMSIISFFFFFHVYAKFTYNTTVCTAIKLLRVWRRG